MVLRFLTRTRPRACTYGEHRRRAPSGPAHPATRAAARGIQWAAARHAGLRGPGPQDQSGLEMLTGAVPVETVITALGEDEVTGVGGGACGAQRGF